jgi:hypothetical protein
VIFFALIILILIASTIRQRFCDGYIVQIPLWLLGIINAIIFCIGFVPLFGGVDKGSSSTIYFVYFTALFNQFTLAVIVIYTIYKVCFMTNSSGNNNNNNNNSSFFGFNNNDPIGGGNHYYSRDHRQYALAATGELDTDSDIELELDLYSSGLNDSYQPYADSADGYYENDDQNNNNNNDGKNTNNNNNNNNSGNNNNNGSIKGKKQQDFASLNSLGSGNSGHSGGRDITMKTKNSSSGMMNTPNFDINLGDEYTDVE